MTVSPQQTLPSDLLRGLDERERQRDAEAFFAAFSWDGIEPDPKTMTADRFFALL